MSAVPDVSARAPSPAGAFRSGPLLCARGFGIAFGPKTIISSLDFEVEPGSISVLTGAPGAGKSTLLRTLAGISQQNSRFHCWGEVRFLGQPLGEGAMPLLARSDARLMQSTVLDALTEAARANPARGRSPGRLELQDELQELGVPELSQRLSCRTVELSPVLQRVMPIVLGAMRRAPLLLLDEPTHRLNEADTQLILGVMKAAARHCSLLVAMENEAHAHLIATHRLLNGAPLEPPLSGARAPSLALRPLAETAASPLPSEGEDARESAAEGLLDGFVWVTPGKLAGLSLPGGEFEIDAELAALGRLGITSLVTLTKSDIPAELLSRHGLGGLHLPIRHGEPPTVAQTSMLLIRMQGMLRAGEVLAVHCSDGLGRTGTVLAAWLMREQGLSAEEVLKRLRQIDPRFVESPEQEAFLRAYEHSFFKHLN